jgi:hypothetical protein
MMMSAPNDPKDLFDEVDGAVLAQIRGMYDSVDPVPAELYSRVRFAIDLETADRELARLCEDMRFANQVRGAERTHALTFESENLTIGVTVTRSDHSRIRLDGWHAPPGSLRIELRTAELRMETMSDEDGRFVIDGVPPGEVQLLAYPTPGSDIHLSRTVVTPLTCL